MFFRLKRFLSVSLCFLFYFILFAGNFCGNSVCDASHGASSIRKFIPIDISSNFNSNAIWGKGDSWDDFATQVTDRRKGVDGAYAFYTNSNHNSNGMPDDGRATIGGIPFNFHSQNGDDCIKLCPALNQTTHDVNIGGIKVKNIYIIGTAGAINTGYTSEAEVKIYDKSNNEITKYAQKLDVYDWYDQTTLDNVKGKERSSIVDYKRYGDRAVNGDYIYSNACVQCWRLNKFSDSDTTFDNEEIGKINVTFNGNKTKKTDGSSSIGPECCFTIFAVTAEVKYDDNIKISDVKHNSFKIACETEGEKKVKITTTEGLNSEGMTTVRLPYTQIVAEGINYCTIYDPDKNAYYYFAITTKKSLKLVVQTHSNLVYNGAAQKLVTEVQTLNAEGNPRPEDENTLLKANIYLRIINVPGTPIRDTGWHNLNYLANLTATNAGTYNVNYYIDEDELIDYELVKSYATIVNININ